MRRRVVLFEVMGTLVVDPFPDVMCRFFGLDEQQLLADKHPTAWVEFEYGRLSEPEYLRHFFADERSFDADAFVDAVASAYTWLPGMEALVAELRAAGVELHALSNYPVWFRRIEARLNLSRYVPWTFVSCVTGFRKPDRAAYRHALAALGAVPADCAFVDDRANNCDAASALGIRSFPFVSAAELKPALQAWLRAVPGAADP